jgi:hypothetical protein
VTTSVGAGDVNVALDDYVTSTLNLPGFLDGAGQGLPASGVIPSGSGTFQQCLGDNNNQTWVEWLLVPYNATGN